MSSYSAEQINVVQSYLDDCRNAEKQQGLKSLLQSASVEDRLHLINNVKDSRKDFNILLMASRSGLLGVVMTILEGFTTDQALKVEKMQSKNGYTAVYLAANNGYSDVASYLLNLLTEQQRADALKLQNTNGDTALHRAAVRRYSKTFELILSLVPPERQGELLNMKNNKQKSVLAVAEPDTIKICWIVQAFDEMNKAVTAGCKQTEELVEKNKQLEIQKNQQAQLIAEQTKEIGEQKEQLTDLQSQLTDIKDEQDEQKQTQLSLSVRCTEFAERNTHLTQALEETNDQLEVLKRNKMEQEKALEETNEQLEELKRNKMEQKEALEQTNKAVVASSEQITQLEEQNKELEKENHLQAKALLNLGNDLAEQRRLTERETNQRAEEMERMRVRQEEMQRLMDHLHIYLRIEDQELEELDEQ